MPTRTSTASKAAARKSASRPFATYDEAKAAWRKRAWETVDQAHARAFRIEEEGGDICFWVVGGPYCDTTFTEPAPGGGEQWFGPFDTYDDAGPAWSRHAWSTVDDAMCRYRIRKAGRGPDRIRGQRCSRPNPARQVKSGKAH